MSVVLNRQDCTVNFDVFEDGLTAQPLLSDSLCNLWSGARANASALHGKLYFVVEVLEHLGEDDSTHEVLIGLSSRASEVSQLGTGSSYAISSSAHKWTASKSEAFGTEVEVGDKVGCFLDLESEICTVSFAINNTWLGAAFEIPRPVRAHAALLPHIMLKNVQVRADFTGESVADMTEWPAEAASYEPWTVYMAQTKLLACHEPHCHRALCICLCS